MSKYDFLIAGRWRNKDNIIPVLKAVRGSGRTAYCFIENSYEGQAVEFDMDGDPDMFMQDLEALPLDHPFIRKIFEADMSAERDSENFLLVLPAGTAGHIEAGAAYGMGKRCYAVGPVEKTETLYCIFDEIFPDLAALQSWLDRPETDSLDNNHPTTPAS
jgi:hypothetical protein